MKNELLRYDITLTIGRIICDMDIIVLSIVAGLVVAGGLWMASRETKSKEKHPAGQCHD